MDSFQANETWGYFYVLFDYNSQLEPVVHSVQEQKVLESRNQKAKFREVSKYFEP